MMRLITRFSLFSVFAAIILAACSESFTDPRDGKSYAIVQIGSQTWMAENMDYEVQGSACPEGDDRKCSKYGRLYTWDMARTVCPEGWHLPDSADFEKLIAECDKRGIHVITDLVVNHSSNQHEWFIKACEEVRAGNFDGYAKYYHIVKEEDAVTGYAPIEGTEYYYEANFSDTMPELNLSNPDVREEIKKIMKFWLDKGVAGFRLDAIKYYDTGGDDGKEFCKWLAGDHECIE